MRPSRLHMMAFCPEHPKWDQNPKFTPLSEMTSIPTPFSPPAQDFMIPFPVTWKFQLSITHFFHLSAFKLKGRIKFWTENTLEVRHNIIFNQFWHLLSWGKVNQLPWRHFVLHQIEPQTDIRVPNLVPFSLCTFLLSLSLYDNIIYSNWLHMWYK